MKMYSEEIFFATQHAIEENNVLKAFVDNYFVASKIQDNYVTVQEIYEKFKKEVKEISKQKFSKEMKNLGIINKRIRRHQRQMRVYPLQYRDL